MSPTANKIIGVIVVALALLVVGLYINKTDDPASPTTERPADLPFTFSQITPATDGGIYATDDTGQLWRVHRDQRETVDALDHGVISITPVIEGGVMVSTMDGMYWVKGARAHAIEEGRTGRETPEPGTLGWMLYQKEKEARERAEYEAGGPINDPPDPRDDVR